MNQKTSELFAALNEEQLLTFLEIARVSLTNPKISGFVLDQLDLSDDEGEHLVSKLEQILN